MSVVGATNFVELDADDAYDKRCCEIFITRKRYLLFHCLFCKGVLASFKLFLQHLQEQHSDGNCSAKDDFDEQHEHQPEDQVEHEPVEERLDRDQDLDKYDDEYEATDEDDCGEFSINEDGSMDLRSDEANTEEPYLCLIEEDGNADLLEENDIIIEDNNYTKQEILEPDDPNNISQENIYEDAMEIAKDPNYEETTMSAEVVGILCEKCNRTFYSDRLFQKHIGMYHSTDRKYKCKVCGVAFKEIFNLRTHIRRHMNLKNYTCSFCPKKFHTKTEQTTHERRHTGERPFVCSECGVTFVTSGSLNEHMKRHKGFRPHQCTVCSKCFFDAGQLKSHAAVHSKIRSYTCEICNASFPRRKSLNSHKKLHENKREYECHLCNANFNQRPALYTHLRNRHKIIKGSLESEDSATDLIEILGK